MYSAIINAKRVAAANIKFQERFPGHELTYHSIDDISNWNEHLKKIKGKNGGFKRDLTVEESRWITNERMIAKLDHLYALTRYCFFSDLDDRIRLFTPNLAQRIILDILSDMEDLGVEIVLQFLKARRLGVSTVFELLIALRLMFEQNMGAVIAAATPSTSSKMSRMAILAIERFPFWMRPLCSYLGDAVGNYKQGVFFEFHFGLDIESARNRLDLEHGTQTADIGRSYGPRAVHLSELAKFDNPGESIDAGLMKAMIPSARNLCCLEGTSEGPIGWWPEKYDYNKKNWPGIARMRPTFLPWFIGVEIYPRQVDLLAKGWFQIKDTWQPDPKTVEHARAAQEQVKSDPLLRKHLGEHWEMPREQMFFFESDIAEYRKTGKLHLWRREMACVAGETKISSSRGILNIKDAQQVEILETGNVSKWWSHGDRPVMTLRTALGRKLTATYDERFLLASGEWRELQDLKEGDELTLSKPQFGNDYQLVEWFWLPDCKVTLLINERWGRFLGYFMGDGCYSARNTVAIGCDKKDVDVIAEVSSILQSFTGKAPGAEVRKGMVVLRSTNSKWNDVLVNLETISPRHSKALGRNCGWKRRVCVPRCIWESPRSVVREFLSALFECDGWAGTKHVRVSMYSAYEDFLRDVQLLLMGFGINSRIFIHNKTMKQTDGAVKHFEGRELQIRAEDALVFYRDIGFRGKRKQGARKVIRNHWRTIRDGWADKVATVTPAGVAPVYDLTVPGAHAFGANGILIHNSDDRSAWASGEKSVFDAELTMRYRDTALSVHPEVFGLKCKQGIKEEVPKRYQPIGIDHKRKGVRVTADWTHKVAPFEFEFYPLRFGGWNGFDETGKVLIYEWPRPGETYSMSTDNSDGKGEDSSVIKVLRKGGRGVNDAEVASFASSGISGTEMWPWTLALGTLYSVRREGKTKQPIFIPETNREGGTQLLREMYYRGWKVESVYAEYRRKSTARGRASRVEGFHTSPANRPDLVQRGIQALTNEMIEVNSPAVVDEMDVFVRHPNGTIAAAKNRHDDHLLALFLAFWALYYDEPRATGSDPFIERTRAVPEEQLFPLASDPAANISEYLSNMVGENFTWPGS